MIMYFNFDVYKKLWKIIITIMTSMKTKISPKLYVGSGILFLPLNIRKSQITE